jgi:hypothetical protein
MEENNTNEFDPREMRQFLYQLSETYDSPFRNDKNEDNFDAFINKQSERMSEIEAEW